VPSAGLFEKNNVDPDNKGLTEVDPDNKGVTSSDPENKGVSLFPHSSPKAGLSGPPPSFQGPEKTKGAAFGCAFHVAIDKVLSMGFRKP